MEPASLLPLSAHMSYGQMRMALYNVAPDLQVSPRAQSFAHFGLHPPYHCTHHSNRGCMAILKRRPQPLVVPEFLRTLVFARPRGDDQFADCTFSPSLDMSR